MKTKIWAHRGASAYAPENTMEAFKLAVTQGADGIELDVQLTKDGEVVVIHDEKIDRVSDGTGFVKDLTLNELKKFNYNKTNTDFKKVEIPTLEEVYKEFAKTKVTFNIELKTNIFPYKGIIKKTIDLEEKYNLGGRIIYSSFNHETVVKIKERSKDCKVGILFSDGFINITRYASKLGVDAIHPIIYLLQDEDLIKKAHRRDLEINAWTANTKEEIEFLLKKKVNALITNYPDVAFNLRKEFNKESKQ